jgi:nucleotide-binding universal stress UspA family protein
MTAAAPPVRTILVALDESPRAPLVLATASMMARGLAARLFPIRVLVIPPQIPPAAHTHPDGLEGVLELGAREDLQGLMDAEPLVQFGTSIVVEGEPWREILVAASDLDVDLIVVGSHRYHGLDRILGTTAAKVVNHADRNVLVVHARPEGTKA